MDMIPRQAGFDTNYPFVEAFPCGCRTCHKMQQARKCDTTKRVSRSVLQKHFAATRAKMRSVKSGSSSIALVRTANSNSMHYYLPFNDHGSGKLCPQLLE